MGVAAVHDPATLFTADVYGAWVTSGFWGVDNVLQPRTRHEAYDARTGCRQPDSPRWGTPGGHQSGLLRDTGPSRARDTPTKMDREDNRRPRHRLESPKRGPDVGRYAPCSELATEG